MGIKTNKIFKAIEWKQVVQTIFWMLFLVCLIVFTILFTKERNNYLNYIFQGTVSVQNPFGGLSVKELKKLISDGILTTNPNSAYSGATIIDAYKWLYMVSLTGKNYSLTNFSLMTFINNAFSQPATDPTTAWTNRSNALDLAYSYLFITALITIVGLAMQVFISCVMIHEQRKIKKFNLSTKFATSTINLTVFKIKLYTDFIMSLAIVFAFFNFLSTLIVIGYWLLNWISWFIFHLYDKKYEKNNTSMNDNRSNLQYLAFVMIYQNIYTLVKAVFLSRWGVNLDLIFSIILPIGTITVIVGLFIKNLLNSKISNVMRDVKNINSVINTFRTFYYTNRENALKDFDFIAILPPMIKNPLTKGDITTQQTVELINELDDTTKFIEDHYAKNVKEKQFMLYTLFNNVTNKEQINEMKENILKLQAKKK